MIKASTQRRCDICLHPIGRRERQIAFGELSRGAVAHMDCARVARVSGDWEVCLELLNALERCRGQWIHSVNRDACLAAIAKATGRRFEEVETPWEYDGRGDGRGGKFKLERIRPEEGDADGTPPDQSEHAAAEGVELQWPEWPHGQSAPGGGIDGKWAWKVFLWCVAVPLAALVAWMVISARWGWPF